MMLTKGFRARFAAAYTKGLEKEALKHTRKLMAEATYYGIKAEVLTIEVHGQRRADAYMMIGWQPRTETTERQQWGSFNVDVPVITLEIMRWK